MSLAVRPSRPDDAAAVARLVAEGFETYSAFAPDGWVSPEDGSEERAAAYRRRMSGPECFTLVAVAGDGVVAHAAFEPSGDEGVAHLWNLFVAGRMRGRGLGRDLLELCLERAGALGFREMRLFTPAGARAAMRFYEREGFGVRPREVTEIDIGLPLVELRRDLRG